MQAEIKIKDNDLIFFLSIPSLLLGDIHIKPANLCPICKPTHFVKHKASIVWDLCVSGAGKVLLWTLKASELFYLPCCLCAAKLELEQMVFVDNGGDTQHITQQRNHISFALEQRFPVPVLSILQKPLSSGSVTRAGLMQTHLGHFFQQVLF